MGCPSEKAVLVMWKFMVFSLVALIWPARLMATIQPSQPAATIVFNPWFTGSSYPARSGWELEIPPEGGRATRGWK
jgi:hypothetical protein